ncbi:MAG: hypothetical protein L0Z51_10300 [Candidatus Latescibacteria bacterium]|nr:hypothetical protein [Candidatus Latescibacterota bacterium]
MTAASPSLAAEPFAKVGTTSMLAVLDFPVGVRNMGMGGTGVADMSQPANGYFNPASLAWTDATYVSYGHEDLFFDIEMNDARLTSGYRWGDSSGNAWRLGGGFGYTAMTMEPVVVRTVFLPEGTGESYEPDDYYVTTALAGAWERGGESIAVGVAAKYVRIEFASDEGTAWAFDYGFVAAKGFIAGGSMLRPRVGFSMTNIGEELEYDDRFSDIAGETRMGLGFDFASPAKRTWGRNVAAVSGAFDADHVDRDVGDSYWAFGWEVSALQFIQMRAGYQWFDRDNYSVVSLGYGMGWEFGRMILRADYTHVSEPPTFFGVDRDRDLFGATVGARF